MGLTGKSLFRRRNRKTKKKLAESQALLDSLTVQIEETENREAQIRLQLSEKKQRLQNILETKTSLLERVKKTKERLERVVQLNAKAEAKVEQQRHQQQVDFEACVQLEKFHQELPVNVWNLQAQICKAFRLIETTKQAILSATLKRENCKEKLEMKREEVMRSRIKVKATKDKISKTKCQIQKMCKTKRIQDFHKKCMETLVLYVMQMNLRAANSRIKMVERRERHLQKMLDGISSEADMYGCLTNEIRKKQFQTRPIKMSKQISSIDVGIV